MLAFIALTPQDPVVQRLSELALFSILFSDGMRLNLRELTSKWRVPGRALIIGHHFHRVSHPRAPQPFTVYESTGSTPAQAALTEAGKAP